MQWRIHGGPECPRTLPWLQAGPGFSSSGASLLVTSISVSGYWILVPLSRCFGLSVALIQLMYWGPHNLLGPYQYVGPSVGMTWLSVVFGVPDVYVDGQSVGALSMILWLLVDVESLVCTRTMDLRNIL